MVWLIFLEREKKERGKLVMSKMKIGRRLLYSYFIQRTKTRYFIVLIFLKIIFGLSVGTTVKLSLCIL